MEIVAAESTNLFIGTEAAPRQVVKVVVRGTDADGSEPGRVRIEGARVRGGEAIAVGPLGPGQVASPPARSWMPRSSSRVAAVALRGPRSGSPSPSPAGGCS